MSGDMLPPKFLRLPSFHCQSSATEMYIDSISRLKHSAINRQEPQRKLGNSCGVTSLCLCGPHIKVFGNSSLVPNMPPPKRTSQGLRARQGSKNGARTDQTAGGSGGTGAGLIRECLAVCKVKHHSLERMEPSGGDVPTHTPLEILYLSFFFEILLNRSCSPKLLSNIILALWSIKLDYKRHIHTGYCFRGSTSGVLY